MKKLLILLITLGSVFSCDPKKSVSDKTTEDAPFLWENASVYFLLTDRFNNADTTNDFKHPMPPAPYRGYMGGDIKGITNKINENYFTDLGVNAIWMTPLVENIEGSVDEGTGLSYGFHGYWTKDWTAIDSRLGTENDVKEMVQSAHKKGIRVLMDAVINHTGPVTPQDTQWPDEWVRTGPKCEYKDSKSTITCTLVDNLPDIKTESTQEVTLPTHIIEKWKKEGRYDKEMKELDAFFERTGHPRRPFYYIVKWLTDLIRKYGIDGFRVDTVKHTEEEVWKVLFEEAKIAYEDWKKENPNEMPKEQEFFMVGEVYNYFIGNGKLYDFGDRKVDYFDYGFKSLINFDFKQDATKPYREMFEKYDQQLFGPLAGKTVLNYISSHDDGSPYDAERQKTYESATRLMLNQGMAQIYYGDEIGRALNVKADGDAKLRSPIDWSVYSNDETKNLLAHWQKLGKFRKENPSVGAGRHFEIEENIFARTLENKNISNKIVFAVNQKEGKKSIPVKTYFTNKTEVKDFYSGKTATVIDNVVIIDTPYNIVLLSSN